eukprot:scaffold300355_cov79-Cyclotella_meneghiniana.AAC.2
MATFETIHDICFNSDNLSDSDLVLQLQSISIDPRILSTQDEVDERTLLHYAAASGRPPEFCKVLHGMDANLVKTADFYGRLPIHDACFFARLNTVKSLFEIYPDSIYISDHNGENPLHMLINSERINGDNEHELVVLVALMLKDEEDVASTIDSYGDLPLHLACYEKRGLTLMKLLFDAHPDGIFFQDNDGYTPLDIARSSSDQSDVVNFFDDQLDIVHQAQEDKVPDSKGQIPIHRVLQSENALLGTIKLMTAAHPASVTVADNQGCIPLHYASRSGDLNIVKYFVEEAHTSLTTLDSGGNLPLHHACLAGKPDIINYILMKTDHGVSILNKDGKLPIQLLLFDALCDRDLQYVDAVDSLLLANPIDSLAILSPGFFAGE